MKSYIKGIITGFLISATVFAIPVVAENIDALFNQVRINVNGVDEIQWGENIELDNGETTPSSILYNGTTYLPMRKLGELSGNKIYWNGDSGTVSMTGPQKDIEVVAEKPDKNGNVWKYYTFTASEYDIYLNKYIDVRYLGVKDEARGFERVYKISGNVQVTDNEIYFLRVKGNSGYPAPYSNNANIVKLSFENDENTQDGEELQSMSYLKSGSVIDGYVYYILDIPGNASHSELWVYDYMTGQSEYFKSSAWIEMYVKDVQDNENEIVFDCGEIGVHGDMSSVTVIYDKETNTFNKQ